MNRKWLAGAFLAGWFAAASSPVFAQAFTITRIARTRAMNGIVFNEVSEVTGIRSDGSKAVKVFDKQGWWLNITLPKDKVLIQYDPSSRQKTSWPLHADMIERAGRRFDANGRCADAAGSDRKFLGTGTIMDIPVFRYGAGFDARTNSFLVLESLAPSLNCFQVHLEQTKLDAGGKPFSLTVQDTVSIQRGEPDPALFEVPAAAKEVLPSKLLTDRFGPKQDYTRQDVQYKKEWAGKK